MISDEELIVIMNILKENLLAFICRIILKNLQTFPYLW